VGLKDTDVEVVVVINPAPPARSPRRPRSWDWPPDFFRDDGREMARSRAAVYVATHGRVMKYGRILL
jgi:hypothetical protein